MGTASKMKSEWNKVKMSFYLPRLDPTSQCKSAKLHARTSISERGPGATPAHIRNRPSAAVVVDIFVS